MYFVTEWHELQGSGKGAKLRDEGIAFSKTLAAWVKDRWVFNVIFCLAFGALHNGHETSHKGVLSLNSTVNLVYCEPCMHSTVHHNVSADLKSLVFRCVTWMEANAECCDAALRRDRATHVPSFATLPPFDLSQVFSQLAVFLQMECPGRVSLNMCTFTLPTLIYSDINRLNPSLAPILRSPKSAILMICR